MSVLTEPSAIRTLLDDARVVAVLGAHPETSRPASYVPAYLHRQGYRILPVNPLFTGTNLWGEPVRATLAELGEVVDLVDVFRGSWHLAGHVDDILAMNPAPRSVWLQLGIRNDAFAARIAGAGIQVVQDRCTLADHRAWGLGPR